MKTLLLIISCFCFTYAFSQPIADFHAITPNTGCAPLVVNFESISTGNPTELTWDLGNGSLAKNVTKVGAVYNNPGTYTVKLVATNSAGSDLEVKVGYVTVYPAPIAKFAVDRTVGCSPVTVKFTDQSTDTSGGINKWVWDFGVQPPAGATGVQQTQFTYTDPGYYSPSLTVTSVNGCSTKVSYSRLIRVVQGINVDFKDLPTTTCKAPYNIPIINETNGPGTLNYTWDLNNGAGTTNIENPIAVYNAPGTYSVKLTATSNLGCKDSATKTITVTPYTSSFSLNSPDTACPNQTLTFTNTSSPRPTKFTWDFGDSTSIGAEQPVKTYANAGTYVVTLTNDFSNCKDTVQKTITIANHIPTDFTATNNKGCKAPLNVTFQSTTPANQVLHYHWDFGDGSFVDDVATPTHQYNALGSYDVTLTITTIGGCQATATKFKFVQIAPGNLSIVGVPTNGCVPYTFTPTANSTTPDPISTYAWTFGDGGTSTSAAPSHVYSTTGQYNVSLTVTTATGCSLTSTMNQAVKVGTPLTSVDFTSNTPTPCATGGVQFQAVTVPAATEFLWDFGDGTPLAGGSNPLHNFADTGFFTVSLTALNSGCPLTQTKPRYIHVLPPLARFTKSVPNCANPLTIAFTNTSKVDPSLGAISYLWQFNDGSPTSSTPSPTHTFPDTGTHVVSLTATNGACSHTYTDTLHVAFPEAKFSVSKSALCKFEKFIVKATGDTSKISTYNWSFNGGPAVSRPYQLDTSFAPTGNYSITLNVVDKNGCPASTTVNNAITVSGPSAKFGSDVPGGCNNTTVTFIDSSTSALPIKKWTWFFGDGPSKDFTAAPFTHTYTQLGVYAVKLTITDNAGCTDTASLPTPISITKPVAGFKADFTSFCPGVNLQFTDTSRGSNLQYMWDFGDGKTSDSANPKHAFVGPDSFYTVSLKIVDNVGCRDSTTVQNFVHIIKPTAAFTYKDTSSICNLLETSFFFGAKNYTYFIWDFGDSTTSISMNPQHFYNSFGKYTATLYAYGNGGCYDSAQRVVNLYNPNTNTQVTYSPISACNKVDATFNIVTPPNTTFSMYYGDGTWDSTQNKVLHYTYGIPGYYQPIVLLKDQYDCQASVPGNSGQVEVLGALPIFNIDKKQFCDSATVNMQNLTIANDPVISQTWDYGNGITSSGKDGQFTYTASGQFPVTLTVNTQRGCTNSRTDTVFAFTTPDPSIVSPDKLCLNAAAPINGMLAQPDTAITWTWTFGDGRGSNAQNNLIAYNKTGDYLISLVAENKIHCKDSVSKPIVVYPNPTVQTKNVTIPIKGSVPLPVSYTGSVTTYTWQPPAGLSCTDCAVPVASPQTTTTYHISVADSNACVASADLVVSVLCTANNYFVPNTFSPNGDGMNDVFYPRGNALTRIAHMQIFNRWGQLIFDKKDFTANDASMGWDGKVNGQLAPQDVYVYVIDFICENSQIVPYKGNVALIR